MKRSAESTCASRHGGRIRGADIRSRSTSSNGQFHLISGKIEPSSHSAALTKLGAKMIADIEWEDSKPAPGRESLKRRLGDKENSGIPAASTYFGQFIDRELSFDQASSPIHQDEPEARVNQLPPGMGSESLYGRGV